MSRCHWTTTGTATTSGSHLDEKSLRPPRGLFSFATSRLADVLIGSHVRSDNPLAGALADEADVVQFFLGDPQSWKKPPPREDAGLLPPHRFRPISTRLT